MGTLTRERLRELLHYDPETGIFTHRISRGRVSAGQVAGCMTRGYLVLGVDGRVYRAHVLAWLLMTGAWPEHGLDHINGQPADNRLSNLRDVPARVNAQNKRRPHSNNRTGFLGVTPVKGRFRAVIGIRGKAKHVGCFATAQEAHAAYLTRKRVEHEGNTL